MLGGARAGVLCAVVLLAVRVEGQAVHGFQWKFGSNFVSQEFTECQTLPIIAEPLLSNSSVIGVAPFYLIAFEVGGIPTTTMVGSDPSNLTWTANHKRGTSLMLSLMDSNGSTGGVPPNLFTMNAGSDTSCIPPPPSNTATLASVHPNVTDPSTLTTCQPWGLTIKNGKQPYQVVLSALNSGVITNVTMGDGDDVFTFIDRADPNGQLMASVVDATGQWGISSNITHTVGSTDVDCVGLVSTSANSTTIAQQAANAAQAAADASRRRRTGLIVGLVVGLGVPILIGLAVVAWLYSRQKSEVENGIWDNQDVHPRPLPYTEDAGATGSMQEIGAPPLSAKSSAFAVQSAAGSGLEVTPIPPVYFDREITHAQQHAGHSDSTAASASHSSPIHTSPTHSSPTTTSPTSIAESSARYRKAREAAQGHLYAPLGSSANPSAQTSVASLQGLPVSPRPSVRPSRSLLSASLDPDIEPDIIIQHRDGGVVQELPPPYADRLGVRASTNLPPDQEAPPETASPATPPNPDS